MQSAPDVRIPIQKLAARSNHVSRMYRRWSCPRMPRRVDADVPPGGDLLPTARGRYDHFGQARWRGHEARNKGRLEPETMQSFSTAIARFFQAPDLPAEARRTFRFHLAYALLDAAAGGILLNAPLVALKALSAQTWHLPLRELYSGVGMLATLYLGNWMAPRLKMPFVFLPGVACAICAMSMATATSTRLLVLDALRHQRDVRDCDAAGDHLDPSVELPCHPSGPRNG